MDIKVNVDTDFFKVEDNFKKQENVKSIFLYKANNYDTSEITFVIPTFKRVDTLQQTLKSILTQKGDYNYTIIVLDNNPERNDVTELYMKDLNVSCISYVKNCENLGMAGNWNRGIVLSRSKWICLLHDDDVIVPEFLSEMLPYTKKYHDAAILQSRKYRTASPEIQEEKVYDGKMIKISDLDFYQYHILDVPSGILYNRDIVMQEGGFDSDFYPSLDYCFHTKIASKYPVYLLNKPLTWYREGTQNASKLVDTQIGWLIVDYYLVLQLLSNHHIPKFIIRPYLEFKTEKRAASDQQLWGQPFDIPYKELNWHRYSKASKKIANKVLSILIKLSK